MYRYTIALLMILAGSLFAAAGSSSVDDLDSSASHYYSVMISLSTPMDAGILEDQGFLIEWAHGNKAKVYVDAERDAMLQHMGYETYRIENPVPLVPYPSITEIYDSIDDVIAAHPDICRLVTIGTSVQGRPIEAVVVSDNVNQEEIEPEMRLQASIHGDEKTAAMTALNFLQVLTDNYATSSMCQYIVNNTEMWIIPVLNPDGYALNQRYNANGIDLNRNCSYMGPGSGGGSTAFSEPETQALRDLTMQNWPAEENFINPFTAGLSLHGGSECINTPWNYTGNPLPEDSALIHQQAIEYMNSPQILSYFGGNFWMAYPGWSWYETHGDVNDWSYGECGTVDHTVEVDDDKQAADWPGVANAHYMAMLQFFTGSTYGIWGTVTNSSGDPIDALLQIGISDSKDSEALRFCRTDVTLGDYHKALVPGTYNVTVSADGYNSQTVTDVVVGSQESVEVSFVLTNVGIEDPGTQAGPSSLSVFPNPVSSFCSFNLPDTGVGGTVSIYDITGRSVILQDVSPGTESFSWNLTGDDGSPVPCGMYIARFTSGSENWSTRLIVNR